MNKIFKIVWNAARGKMMVVNEATSSVQTGKKAAVTVAVIGALGSGVAMAVPDVQLDKFETGYTYSESDGVHTLTNANLSNFSGTDSYLPIVNKVDTSLKIKGGEFKLNTINNNKNGYPKGGLIRSEGNLEIEGVHFNGNTLISTDEKKVYGSVIHQTGKQLTVSGSEFKNNYSQYMSGALDLRTGTFIFTGNKFIENSTGSGGGVMYIQGANTTFVGNTFDGNYSEYHEGAVSFDRGTGSFDGDIFQNNKAKTGEAGAVAVQTGAIVSFNGVLFDTNSAKTDAGALYIKASSNSSVDASTYQDVNGKFIFPSVANSTFTGNEAKDGNGGAIWNDRVLILVGGNTFSENTAGGKGNDIYNTGTLIILGENTFEDGIEGAGTLRGDGKLVMTSKDAKLEGTVTGDDTSIEVQASGSLTDELNGNLNAFKAQFNRKDDEDKGRVTYSMAAGAVVGEVVFDENGNVVEKVNKANEELANHGLNVPRMLSRVMMNDLRKRMGDVRAGEGTHGAWVRYNGGEASGLGLDNEFSMIQVGIDTVPVVDAPRFGVAFSYAQSDTTGTVAESEAEMYSIAAYGTKMYDNGMFVDVIGRMATMDTDITLGNSTGTLDNISLSLSGEVGWRFDVTDTIFVEPSAELTYTYVNSDKFTMDNVDHELDSTDSLMGRVGFVAGLKCPENKGDVYVRASVVHEFLGDATFRTALGNTSRDINLDGEDTWVEFGIGAQFNVNKNTYVYADIERTEGAKLEEDWRANVGVRFAF